MTLGFLWWPVVIIGTVYLYRRRKASDLQLRQSLAIFAIDNRFDQALSSLWQEIRLYPASAKSDDFEMHNPLKLADVCSKSEGKFSSVKFSYEGHSYEISENICSGFDFNRYADISLFEDGNEVFAVRYGGSSGGVSCSLYTTDYIISVKKSGDWQKSLLRLYAIQIEVRSKNLFDANMIVLNADSNQLAEQVN